MSAGQWQRVYDHAVEDPRLLVDHDAVDDADAPPAAVVDRHALRERQGGYRSAEIRHEPTRSRRAGGGREMAQEPVAGELGHALECARLLEQVAGARHDL